MPRRKKNALATIPNENLIEQQVRNTDGTFRTVLRDPATGHIVSRQDEKPLPRDKQMRELGRDFLLDIDPATIERDDQGNITVRGKQRFVRLIEEMYRGTVAAAGDKETLGQAAKGVESLMHLAGVARPQKSDEEIETQKTASAGLVRTVVLSMQVPENVLERPDLKPLTPSWIEGEVVNTNPAQVQEDSNAEKTETRT